MGSSGLAADPESGSSSLFVSCFYQTICMLEKLFGRGSKKKEESQAGPAIHFGRYSDNNKPVAKINRWTDADNLFKDKRYPESLDAFF